MLIFRAPGLSRTSFGIPKILRSEALKFSTLLKSPNFYKLTEITKYFYLNFVYFSAQGIFLTWCPVFKNAAGYALGLDRKCDIQIKSQIYSLRLRRTWWHVDLQKRLLSSVPQSIKQDWISPRGKRQCLPDLHFSTKDGRSEDQISGERQFNAHAHRDKKPSFRTFPVNPYGSRSWHPKIQDIMNLKRSKPCFVCRDRLYRHRRPGRFGYA